MNVTEKQKEMMLSFMLKYPDFGRGRLRYCSENKRKIDALWEQLTMKLNMSGSGPSKSAKEWSKDEMSVAKSLKTWRDWKSNTLKKVSKYKAHMMGTGGGSPKKLSLTAVENALMDFLTPDAAGLSNVSEGGFEDISSNPRQNHYSNFSLMQKERTLEEELKDLNQYSFTSSCAKGSNINEIALSDCSEDSIYSKRKPSPIRDIKQSKKTKCETLVSCFDNDIQNIYNKENIQNTKNEIDPLNNSKYQDVRAKYSEDITKNEIDPLNNSKYQDVRAKYSEDIKKPKVMTTAINLLEKKASASENIKLQFLDIKRQKLQLKKQEIDIRNETLQVLQNINTILSSLRYELVGQYLTVDT